jgi:hypothetical protein
VIRSTSHTTTQISIRRINTFIITEKWKAVHSKKWKTKKMIFHEKEAAAGIAPVTASFSIVSF